MIADIGKQPQTSLVLIIRIILENFPLISIDSVLFLA